MQVKIKRLKPNAIIPTYAKEGGYINSYATGGTIQSGGIRDLYGTPDNQPTMSSGLGGFGLGRLNDLAGEQAMNQAKTLGYAEGGETSLNLDRLPSLNVNTGEQSYNSPYDTLRGGLANSSDPKGQLLNRLFSFRPGGNQSIYDQFSAQMAAQQAQGRAKGGYLSGGGDGMSDSIPATIEGKQQARLADGEFVIPADVVSHIGNGSSKAGSQRLYAMLDKVRKARTGTKKQGKQINPNKYMPA